MYLQYLLTKQGAKTCVLDEHVRPRICEAAYELMNINELSQRRYPEELSTLIQQMQYLKPYLSKIIVWGVGEYANLLLDKSSTFSHSSVKFFVDSDTNKQGTNFRGLVVRSPEEVIDHTEPILIASSFWYHDIIETLAEFGVDQKRILPSYLI